MEKLDYEARDGIAVITLNDPPANTYSYEMMRDLDAAMSNGAGLPEQWALNELPDLDIDVI